jgi:thiamine kinase-like enzyme
MVGGEPGRALAEIPGFAGASVRERLSDGPTNASYLVERNGQRYVLRLDKAAVDRLGLDRQRERRAVELAARAGLTPPLLYTGPGVALRHWLPGRSWGRAALTRPCNLDRLAAVLRSLHEVPGDAGPFDPLVAARHYAARLGTPAAQVILDRAEGLAAGAGGGSSRRVLCHNDLVSENIFETDQGQLLLIDWEYAGTGEALFDLAVVVQHHGLDAALSAGFLDAYLGRSATDPERERLAGQRALYQCLLDLWNMVSAPGAHGPTAG